MVDLSKNYIEEKTIDEYTHLNFLGGKGFCTYYVYKYSRPGANPFGKDNVAVIAPGALAGYAPASGKTCFGAVSPLTGLIHDSYAGEVLGPKLKMAGYDGIVIRGVSSEPVYLQVSEDGADLLSAEKIWGMNTREATHYLKEKHGKKSSVAVIGPAAERRVRYASILVDYHRAAGRGGIGAVWGSKGLKAVVVSAAKPLPEPAKGRRAWRELAKELYLKLEKLGQHFSKYGTNNGLVTADKLGMAPHYNFKYPHLGEVGELTGDNVVRRAKRVDELDQSVFGYMCPIKCSKVVDSIKSEYEHLGMLGAADGIYKLNSVLKAIKIVNELGLDSISAGNVIGWAAESEEKGLLKDVMEWGDDEKQHELLEKIAYRRGIGAVLAEGVRRASEILGFGEEWAVHVKGLEAPAWDPRGLLGFGLSYATADVGASHLRGWPRPHKPPKEPAVNALDSLIYDRDETSVADHMGTCVFLSYTFEDWSRMLEVVYDINYGVEDLRELSWRTETLARLWALQAGYSSADDTVPPRWMEPVPKGPNKGLKAFLSWKDLEEARSEYYKRRGWSPNEGVPLPSTLKRLNLHFALDEARILLRRLEPGLGD